MTYMNSIRQSKKQSTRLVEALEARQVFAAVFPTDVEQYLVELINRARANPSAEAARYDIALNEGVSSENTISTAPKQPLAINPFLTDAARDHSRWMLSNDVFAHEGVGGSDPGERMDDAGYVFAGNWTWGENLAYRSFSGSAPTAANTAQMHEDLFVDEGYPGRGHRVNILSNAFREVGPGVLSGDFDGFNVGMLTTDFASTGDDVFLTGVAYEDGNGNDFYTPGEGLSGITIQAVRTSDAAVFATTSWSSGGYSLKLPPGTYTVTGTGALLGATVTYGNVVIGSENVKRDFYPGAGGPVLTGKIFNDLNGNGTKESGEAGLPKRRIFVDADDDGRFDSGERSAVTDEDGRYSLSVPAGTHRLRQVLPTGWRRTTVRYKDVSVAAGETLIVKSFGATKKVLISGFVFHDLDADALRGAGEAGLANWQIYIDEDRNGLFDPTEASVLTNDNGKYTFAALPAGTYRLRLVPQPGWTRTTVPSHTLTLENGQTATNRSFGVRAV